MAFPREIEPHFLQSMQAALQVFAWLFFGRLLSSLLRGTFFAREGVPLVQSSNFLQYQEKEI